MTILVWEMWVKTLLTVWVCTSVQTLPTWQCIWVKNVRTIHGCKHYACVCVCMCMHVYMHVYVHVLCMLTGQILEERIPDWNICFECFLSELIYKEVIAYESLEQQQHNHVSNAMHNHSPGGPTSNTLVHHKRFIIQIWIYLNSYIYLTFENSWL